MFLGCCQRPALGSVIVEEESIQKTNDSDAQNPQAEPAGEATREKQPSGDRSGDRRGLRRTVWLLVFLMVLLLASSVANLVVSQRAYESSQKQVLAIEQLTQSIKDTQRAIMNLARMLEPAPAEEEEPEEDGGSAGDGSI